MGTGFKDEDLTRLSEKMKGTILGSHRRPINYNVGDPLTPDHWFEATSVWELQAADLSKSNVHKGGIGRVDNSGVRGIGLRFPRFIRYALLPTIVSITPPYYYPSLLFPLDLYPIPLFHFLTPIPPVLLITMYIIIVNDS